ncbi:MAG: cupin domain-containing protein [Candidatus Tectomicrobia bacterium]|nr:cupin domain-containing protein [Candidatus Tectomicrobia bacterium]
MASLDEKMERYLARFAAKEPDWEMFEEARHEGNRRAAYRYVGPKTYRNRQHNTIDEGTFNVSVMYVPPGQGAPMHCHPHEEIFFVLKGYVTVFWEENGETCQRELGPLDLIFNPPNAMHGYRNHGVEPLWLQILVGGGTNILPKYADPALEAVKTT